MTRGCAVRLNEDAVLQLVDPMHVRQVGTVVSVCAQIAMVRWPDGRTFDYSTAWLCVVADHPVKPQLPEAKPKFDTQHSKGWRR